MEKINITSLYNFRKVCRRYKSQFKLTFNQTFFVMYLYHNGDMDFRACDIQIPGLSYRGGLDYLSKLSNKGYLIRNNRSH